jgi:PhnB protein
VCIHRERSAYIFRDCRFIQPEGSHGGRPRAFVELKLPGIALAPPEAKQDFIDRAAEGRIRREHIWTDIVMPPTALGGSQAAPIATPTSSARSRERPARDHGRSSSQPERLDMRLANYLFFTACCEQALEFYRSCGLGAVTEMARYCEDSAMRGKVMHARFEGAGVIFYASDNHDAEPMRGSAHFLTMDDRESLDHLFGNLAEGGLVTTALGVQPWAITERPTGSAHNGRSIAQSARRIGDDEPARRRGRTAGGPA